MLHRTQGIELEHGAPFYGTALMWGVLLGTALQLQQRQLFSGMVYLTCIVAAVPAMLLLWRSRCRPGVMLSVLTALIALASFGFVGMRGVSFLASSLSPELEGRDLQLRGMVVAMPQLRESGVRFRFEVESATRAGQLVNVPPLVDLAWYSRSLYGDDDEPAFAQPPAMTAGQRWTLPVRLKAPHGGVNPFGFDYELAMWEQGVQATGYVRASHSDSAQDAPRLLESTWRYPVERWRQRVRDAIFERLVWRNVQAESATRRAAGVVAALVVGDQRAIDRKDWEIFRTTGVAHLVSISGLHITMFAWLASAVVGRLWRRSAWLCLRIPAQTAAALGGVALATAYASFSGFGVPAQRTILMLAVVSLLRLTGRHWPWPQVWLLACTIVVLWDPWAMLQAGFWLSFVAVGVLFASSPNAPLTPASSPHWPAQLAWHGRQMLRQQWLVTLALAPLGLLLFGQTSVVGLVANVLAIPWVTLVVLPVAFAGILWSALWGVAAWAVQAMCAVLQWLALWPWAQLTLPMTPLWASGAAVLGGLLLALRLPWQLRVLALPCMLPALWWTHERPPQGRFDVLAIDVGQGQAVLVRTAQHSLLYDAGPLYSAQSDAGERVIAPLLKALGESPDVLVLSHRDSDHTGGAQAVLAQHRRMALIASIEPAHALARTRPITGCQAGQRWRWDGVQFEVLHPRKAHADLLAEGRGEQLKSNAMSCVLRVIDAQGNAALLTGDIEQQQEADLLAQQVIAPAQLLLLPHHGSKTSSSAAFLDTAAPQIAIAQAGYRNRFGHPAAEVVARYRERGIALYDTASCGAVSWQSADPQMAQCERERSRRYWFHSPGINASGE